MSHLATLLYQKPLPPVGGQRFRMGQPASATPIADDTDKRILRELSTKTGQRISDLSAKLDISITRIKPSLERLEDEGLVCSYKSHNAITYKKNGNTA